MISWLWSSDLSTLQNSKLTPKKTIISKTVSPPTISSYPQLSTHHVFFPRPKTNLKRKTHRFRTQSDPSTLEPIREPIVRSLDSRTWICCIWVLWKTWTSTPTSVFLFHFLTSFLLLLLPPQIDTDLFNQNQFITSREVLYLQLILQTWIVSKISPMKKECISISKKLIVGNNLGSCK